MIFNLKKFYFESQIEYDNSELKDFLSTSEDKYNLPAKNALFKFEKGKVVEFRKESNGLKILTEKFLPDFDKIIGDLKTDAANKKVILNSDVIKPEIKLSDINLLSPNEEKRIAVDFNNNKKDYPVSYISPTA